MQKKNSQFQAGSASKMAAEQKSISSSSDKKGSSRIGGGPYSSGPNKRSSEEIETDDFKRQKVTFGISLKKNADVKADSFKGSRRPGIQIKLNSNKSSVPVPPVKSRPTAAIFNNEDDDEPEEMPPEARMRMRNIGRDTPTSAGPNSFGKTKQGFCDSKKVFEKSLKAAIEKAGNN